MRLRWILFSLGMVAVAFGFIWAIKGWIEGPICFFGSAITVGIGILLIGGSVIGIWGGKHETKSRN
jgi:hypothetical protein